MNPLIFILLLVSCTDDFNSCYSNNTMAKIYPTAQACEQAMVPSIKKSAFYGQQVFAQCINIHPQLHQQKVKLIWSVTNHGNFLLKSQNVNDKRSTVQKEDILPTLPSLLRSSSTNLLHKKL
ncbi:hypothetical protein MCU_01499 [Bartonella elizabethae Re6043vi]|uniref:Uncharacterized protein n=2 Tax=Bartonella elizabethae TaxID=807 RepID=J1K5S3_BAREL|nr:hypothetical protein [Bartonella elizabethae]EJF82390.1 hypothetical protein MCU_01499 [Bartonella elizabethae Re6043vi]EJF92892.1 hypothetical protein MEE_01537 [Bartonella elizabethae F9251 = ATCC 49927]VEJ41795.1 Uncharacterised protein [Bartonella elizabethae]